jgi:hypothetical protein
VAQTVLTKDEVTLAKLAKLLDTTPKDLIQAHFARVFAACFPLYYTPTPEKAAEVCEKFVQKYIDEKSINTLIPNAFNDILAALLDGFSTAARPVPPRYAPSCIQQILEHLSKGWGVKLSGMRLRMKGEDVKKQRNRKGERSEYLLVFRFFFSS